MIMKFLRSLRRRRKLTPEAMLVLRLTLVVSCLALSASLLITVYAGHLTPATVDLYRLAADLYRAPQGALLLGFLGALYIEYTICGGK